MSQQIKTITIKCSAEVLLFALLIITRLCVAQGESYTTEPDLCIVCAPIQIKKHSFEEIPIPPNTGSFENKPYMDISKITNKNSPQWELLTSLNCVTYQNQLGVSNQSGFIIEQGYIGVAMGTYFDGQELGSKYHLTLETGEVIKVIKVELKADKDTCELGMRSYANDIIEFVIDSNAKFMQDNIGDNGLIFNGNFNNCDKFKGNIIKIEKVIGSEE